MVTGIETAGLILAIFPLAISALEHYREGLEPLKDWKRFRTEFLATVDAAGLQLTIFEDNLEELLAPHIDSDVELRALLDDRRGILWKAPELESRLRDRLPKSYDFLCATIGRLYEILIKLLHKLGIDDGQVRRSTRIEVLDALLDMSWLIFSSAATLDPSASWNLERQR